MGQVLQIPVTKQFDPPMFTFCIGPESQDYKFGIDHQQMKIVKTKFRVILVFSRGTSKINGLPTASNILSKKDKLHIFALSIEYQHIILLEFCLKYKNLNLCNCAQEFCFHWNRTDLHFHICKFIIPPLLLSVCLYVGILNILSESPD